MTLPFSFVERIPSYDAAEVFYVRVDPDISGADNLMKSIYYLLWFPGYFGFNWDALYESLRDLSWIPCRKVVLVHQSLPKLSVTEMKIYLEILRDSVLDWADDESHELEVVFRRSDEAAIVELIGGVNG